MTIDTEIERESADDAARWTEEETEETMKITCTKPNAEPMVQEVDEFGAIAVAAVFISPNINRGQAATLVCEDEHGELFRIEVQARKGKSMIQRQP